MYSLDRFDIFKISIKSHNNVSDHSSVLLCLIRPNVVPKLAVRRQKFTCSCNFENIQRKIFFNYFESL